MLGAGGTPAAIDVTWARERQRFFRSADRRGENPTPDSDAARHRLGRLAISQLFRVGRWPGRVRQSTRRSMPGCLQALETLETCPRPARLPSPADLRAGLLPFV